MIRNESEYKSAVARLTGERRRIAEERARLQQLGLEPEQIVHAIGQSNSTCRELEDEVATYERRTAPTWRTPIA